MKIEYAKVYAVGDRTDNQNRAAVVVGEDAAIMLVFDGMGGHSDGARAAEVGMQVVQDLFTAAKLPIFDPQGFLYMALARAHDEVVKIGLDQAIDFHPRATCAICLIQESGAWWAHIGDSRIYQMRAGKLIARSRDHSHVEVLIQEGAITEEEAQDHPMRNFVECCIGGDASVPGLFRWSLVGYDRRRDGRNGHTEIRQSCGESQVPQHESVDSEFALQRQHDWHRYALVGRISATSSLITRF